MLISYLLIFVYKIFGYKIFVYKISNSKQEKIEANERFILALEEKECPWNVFHEEYHNREARIAAEKDLATIFNMDVKEIKK